MNSYKHYGRFEIEDHCFVIEQEPPKKWRNLHCSRINTDGSELYADSTHIGDGQVVVRDKTGVSVNLIPYDATYLYVRDELTGEVFCPSGMPVPTPVTSRRIEFHLEQTLIQSEYAGTQMRQRLFVPKDLPILSHSLFLKNKSSRLKRYSIFAYCGFDLSGYDSEGAMLGCENYTEIHTEMGSVLAVNRLPGLPSDRFKGFLMSLNPVAGANGYRDHWTHADYSLASPKLLQGWNCDGRAGYGPDCAGILQVKLNIEPGAEARADFIIGQTSGAAEIASLRERLTPELLDQLCAEAGQEERELAASPRIHTGIDGVDGLFNIFIKKQLYTYLINKSGFRDNLQVDQALVMADDKAAENNFLRALASQYQSGSVPHGFRPLNRRQYSDKPAWILQTLPALLKETGRLELVERRVAYLDSDQPEPVWQHALRAMRFLCEDTGRHGLCRQHHADWNDGLEATEAAGERESVFVTMQLCHGLREMEACAHLLGEKSVADECRQGYDHFKKLLNAVAWDGQWYIRTICEDGYRIGSSENTNGSIFLNPQSWAVISGVADESRAKTCMEQVDAKLETDIGFRICHPPYEAFDPRVGRMSNSMPGANENGGCYNHAAGFKAVADCLLGRNEAAWRTFIKVTPDNPENPVSQSGAEPFSYVNSYSCVPMIYGQSGYAWRTGTSGWMLQLMIEHILGARRSHSGLVIDPCLPAQLKQVSLQRRFRGAHYEIQIDNASGRGHCPERILVDNKPIAGNTLPLAPEGSTRQVHVTM
jgi:cellobiose phosphorylase